MKIVLRNAKVYHPSSPHHGKRVDIFIKGKKIEQIGRNLKVDSATEFKSKDLCVSIGWIDLGAQACDPGYEHREDLSSISKAAAAGGYTALAPFPNTNPVTHDKLGVDYLKSRTNTSLVDFLPIGAVTKNCEGKEITEMFDMTKAGAVAFSDGAQSIQHAGVLLRALQYVKAFDGLIIHQPKDKTIARNGQMHEGKTSTMLGLRGIPSMAEELMVQRDLSLNEYVDSRLHFSKISTEGSVDLIKKAKRKSSNITASVSALNLLLTDQEMLGFDTNLKVLPPLRGKRDINALKSGLKDGTIDCIVSNHIPHDLETKNLEFGNAEFGAIGLQTTFAIANMALKDVDLVIEKFAIGIRKILGIELPKIEVGESPNFTIFDPTLEWTFSTENNQSKSKNSPFLEKNLTGKVIGVINNGMSFFN